VDGKLPWVIKTDDFNNFNFLYRQTIYCLNTGDADNDKFIDNSGNPISSFRDGVWHHYALTFDGTNCKLYIDGKYKGKATTYKSPKTTNKSIRIAGGYGGKHSYDFNGSLNDLRVYNNVLSLKEIEDISKGLVLHYKLDE
jgi:hypothetical protein